MKYSFDEVKAHIACGTVQKPSEICVLIRASTDQKVIDWASKHSNTQIRMAAAKHPLCRLAHLVRMGLFDRARTVKDVACVEVAKRSQKEVNDFLWLLDQYPQLALPLTNVNVDIPIETKESITIETTIGSTTINNEEEEEYNDEDDLY